MSLWTPYAEDVALDLTKNVKEKQQTRLEYVNYEYPGYAYPPMYASVGQISPLSGGSLSSYESYPRYEQVYQTSVTRHDLSPPASPVQDQPMKRTFDMVDVDCLSDDPEFQAFERDALRAMAEKNGGTLLGNNPRMRRTVQSKNETADESYKRQRERNNFAAKQSRDRRKLREVHLALKVTYLRREVAALKAMLANQVCGRCRN
ncbi:transcription factor VBP [Manduca sexta]|uniref:transcription factor VBP n=1 Tax=Manduca sexta TaxID=7130 RepID=UPI0018909DD5|nr:transcription factor VBP [Manduca sexta]XP_037293546.1 transcription factor VBP [Manduca sexta]KAG6439679.1 hypothetical protein O3G_MSEX000984 [Manduca sexta]